MTARTSWLASSGRTTSLSRMRIKRGRFGVARRHDYLDRIVDVFAGVAQRRGQVVQAECVGVDLCSIEAFLRHQRLGAVGGTFAFAADAVEVDVVAHDMGDVDRWRFVWE